MTELEAFPSPNRALRLKIARRHCLPNEVFAKQQLCFSRL
jgi:hypothetical protein